MSTVETIPVAAVDLSLKTAAAASAAVEDWVNIVVNRAFQPVDSE